MRQDIDHQSWPGQPAGSEPDIGARGSSDAIGGAIGGVKAGLTGGLVASLPVIGPAFASLCASCVGLGGAVALGAISGWVGPVVLGLASVFIVLSTRRSLRRCRMSCSPAAYPRARMIVLGTMLAVAAGSYALSAFVIAPALRTGFSHLQKAFDHQLP